MRRRQHTRRWALGIALAGVMALTAQSSSQADEWYPGLPDNVHIDYLPEGYNSLGSWGGAAQGGISYAKRAKQWFRSPSGMVTYVVGLYSDKTTNPLVTKTGVAGAAVFVSPKGAPESYGYMAPMTVRSVGFGLMPVEATVQVSQRRQNGYPIPFVAKIAGTRYLEPGGKVLRGVSHSTVIEDALNVQILSVRVDGVDLGLTGDCRTETPAPVRMASPTYTIEDPDRPPTDPSVDSSYQDEWYRTHDPSEYFSPLRGGQLSGSITIPPFTGCTTKAGDDLSALMTLSVSGPDNPVKAVSGWPCAVADNAPLPPGASSPTLAPDGWASGPRFPGCFGTKQLPYPERPDR